MSATAIAPPQNPRAVFDEWLARINQACGAFSATMLGDSFNGQLQDFEGGAMRLSVVDAVQTRLYRSTRDLGRSDDQKYYAVLQLGGQSALEQGGQRAVLDRGDICVIDAARTCSALMMDNSRQISLILPRPMVERSLGLRRVACAQRIPASAPLAGMAGRLIRAASRQARAGLGQLESEAMLEALLSLLKPAIGQTEVADDRHERLFRKACAFIDAHLVEEGLSPEWVAQSVGVSVRGLYRLFSKQGLVVAQHIKNRRLDRCAEALRQHSADEKMASLGYSWGFADSSHFSTAFKNRFGMPPGAYRQLHS